MAIRPRPQRIRKHNNIRLGEHHERKRGNPKPAAAERQKKQRKFWLLLLTVIFIVIGVAYLVYWFLVLRHHQETDDAYVSGNQVQIMAQVSGSVNSVNFDNTDYVKQGDVLLTLDPTDAEQAFERAKTGLANSVRQTHQLIINSKQYQANIALRKTDLSKAENDLKRRVVLGSVDAIGREELQHARDAVDSAKAAPEVAVQQYNANQAMVLNTRWNSSRRSNRPPRRCAMPGWRCSVPK